MTHHAGLSEDYSFTYNNRSSEKHFLYITLAPHHQDIRLSSLINPFNEVEQPNPPLLNREDKFTDLLRRLSKLDLPNKDEIE
jgi:hypothetical protein